MNVHFALQILIVSMMIQTNHIARTINVLNVKLMLIVLTLLNLAVIQLQKLVVHVKTRPLIALLSHFCNSVIQSPIQDAIDVLLQAHVALEKRVMAEFVKLHARQRLKQLIV